MKILLKSILCLALFPGLLQAGAHKKNEKAPWTDPAVAAKENPDFLIQGEYVSRHTGGKTALQVAALDQGKFLTLQYAGGLPGDGWDGGKLESRVLDRAALKSKLKDFRRVERKSPTLGKQAPQGAVVIFDGKANRHIKGIIHDGLLWAGSETLTKFGDFHLHVEFRLPFKPWRKPGSQDRGNSGVYIFNNYEIQVLDSFGLDLDTENNAIKPDSLNTQWCGSFYKQKLPDVPMAFPPLVWQSYDIDFIAPKFDGTGKKTANANITVRQNGVLIHDHVELEHGTGAGAKRPEKEKGPIIFQGHGNPTAFRNVWIVEGKQ